MLTHTIHAESASRAQGSRARDSTSAASNALTITSSATQTLTYVRISYVRSRKPSIMHCTKQPGPSTRYYRADCAHNTEHSVPPILDCVAPDRLYQMPCSVHSKNMSRAVYQYSVRHAVSFVQAHKPGCQQKSFPSPDLCGMVCDKEMELLIPNRGFVAAPVAGGSILAAAHHLRAQAQPAVGVALPGEPPHRQVACLHQVYLDIT